MIAALVADTAANTPNLPSSVLEKLESLGLCPYEILNKALASHQNEKKDASLRAAFAQFKAHKTPTLAPITITTTLPWLEKWVQTTGPETPIGDITLNHLMQTLEGVENPDTYNTRRKHLVNFFSVARRYKLVSENVAQGIPRKNRITNVQILTPEQATRLLLSTFTAFTDPAMGASMRAYYAIGLFAGVRPDELKQLTWEDITLRDEAPPPVDWQRLDLDTSDHIFLSEIIAGESRSAPIFPNLRAWLLTCSPRSGLIVPDINNSLAKKGRCSAAFSSHGAECGRQTF